MINHQKLVIVAIRVGLIGALTTLGWEFPIGEIADPRCDKSQQWDQLDESCKIELLDNGTLPQDNKTLGDLIFSVFRGASYNSPHKQGSGSHPSIDIVTVQGTPVKAIGDGVVYNAGFTSEDGFGNVVTIKHTFNGEDIYSSYSHLNKINVEKGMNVTQGQIVGEVGRTGFTMGKFGNHLDFQITRANAPSHPYGLHDCDTDYLTTVNTGNCRDKLELYTIDPIEFFKKYAITNVLPTQINQLEQYTKVTNENIASNNSIEHGTSSNDEKEIEDTVKTNKNFALPIIELPTIPSSIQSPYISQISLNNSIFSSLQQKFAELQNENKIKESNIAPTGLVVKQSNLAYNLPGIPNSDTDSAPTVNIPYTISRSIPSYENGYENGKVIPIIFEIKDKVGAIVSSKLEEEIHITYDSDIISMIPSRFSTVIQGEKYLFMRFTGVGQSKISIYYGEQLLGTETITISQAQ